MELRKRHTPDKDTTDDTPFKRHRREREDSAKHDPLRQGTHQVTDYVRYAPVGHTQFRLLKLEPGGDDDVQASLIITDTSARHNLRHTGSGEIVEYVVVSSQRKCNVPKEFTIWLSENRVPVTKDLGTFLQQRRHVERHRYIRCDELCVNWRDPIDRESHVIKMGELYSRAERIIVWLGEPNENTDNAMDFMSKNPLTVNDTPAVKLGASDLWQRVPDIIWSVWHPALFEIEHIMFMCGNRKLDLVTFMEMLNRFEPEVGAQQTSKTFAARTGAGWEYMDLPARMSHSCCFKVNDPRDRIYANVADFQHRLPRSLVNYGWSSDEVFSKFMKQQIGAYGTQHADELEHGVA